METSRDYDGGSRITATEGLPPLDGVQVGPDVIVRCRRLRFGRGVRLGVPDADSFRLPGGVRIDVDELVLGDDAQIDRHVAVRGGRIQLDRGVRVKHDSTVNVSKRLVIGALGTVNANCEISGVDVEIGRRLWMLDHAKIGGGSAMDAHSILRVGHWFHLGVRGLLNTARAITIGDEVGLGTNTCIYTHGAYPSALDGKPVAWGPVSVGDRTWIPGAIVNPSVNIGRDCVIGVGSLVTRDVPDGCLAAGVPAKVLKERCYPQTLEGAARAEFVRDFLSNFGEICEVRDRTSFEHDGNDLVLSIGEDVVVYRVSLRGDELNAWPKARHLVVLTDDAIPTAAPERMTLLSLRDKTVQGRATDLTERLLNQLRRYGVRFGFDPVGGHYVSWT